MLCLKTVTRARLREYGVMCALGSLLYAMIEVVYRGNTHFTMVITGGLCGMTLHYIWGRLKNKPLLLCAIIGSIAITTMELMVGCLVNRLLRWDVWNYEHMPLNLWGQICPLFSFYWFLLSFPALMISRCVTTHLAPCLNGGFLFDLIPYLSERKRYGSTQKNKAA